MKCSADSFHPENHKKGLPFFFFFFYSWGCEQRCQEFTYGEALIFRGKEEYNLLPNEVILLTTCHGSRFLAEWSLKVIKPVEIASEFESVSIWFQTPKCVLVLMGEAPVSVRTENVWVPSVLGLWNGYVRKVVHSWVQRPAASGNLHPASGKQER